ncbi:hypothetical protein EC563_24345, partial [Vibrio parahaemolyticus]|nr:hypothetical protein [Vibrio parahaemolyticus]
KALLEIARLSSFKAKSFPPSEKLIPFQCSGTYSNPCSPAVDTESSFAIAMLSHLQAPVFAYLYSRHIQTNLTHFGLLKKNKLYGFVDSLTPSLKALVFIRVLSLASV